MWTYLCVILLKIYLPSQRGKGLDRWYNLACHVAGKWEIWTVSFGRAQLTDVTLSPSSDRCCGTWRGAIHQSVSG